MTRNWTLLHPQTPSIQAAEREHAGCRIKRDSGGWNSVTRKIDKDITMHATVFRVGDGADDECDAMAERMDRYAKAIEDATRPTVAAEPDDDFARR